MSNKYFSDVADFHEKILHDFAAPTPTLVSPEYVEERVRFLLEEVEEFMTDARMGNIVGAADALADIVYVALGTAYRMGLPFPEVWNAVQAANMRKERGMTSRGNKVDAIKPPYWVGPETEIAQAIGNKLEG